MVPLTDLVAVDIGTEALTAVKQLDGSKPSIFYKRLCARTPQAMELWATNHPEEYEIPPGTQVGERKAIKAAAYKKQGDSVKARYVTKAAEIANQMKSDTAASYE